MADPLNPFDYAERFNPRRQDRPVAEIDDAVTAEIKRMRENDLRMDIAVSPTADQVARTSRLARQAGLPPAMVEDRADEIERGLNAQAMAGLADRYPAIGRWAATNPRAAVAAQDDHESLGLIGEAFEGLKKIGARTVESGGWRLIGGVTDTWNAIDEMVETIQSPIYAGMSAIADATGIGLLDPNRPLQDRAKARETGGAYFRSKAQAASDRNRGANVITEGLLQGLETLPLTALALATRDPRASAAVIGATTGATAYDEARREGKDAATAIRYGLAQGTAEGVFEIAPTSALLETLAKRVPIGKSLAQYMAAELPGELSTTLFQSFSEWATLNPDKPYGDWVASLPAAMRDTALGVLGGGTATVVASKAGQRAVDVAGKLLRPAEQAATAREVGAELDRVAKGIEASKLGARDTEALRSVLREQAEESGTTSLYIPGEALQAYMQSDAYDPDRDALRDYAEEIGEAAATGSDFVMPIEDALTKLPGTPAWPALKDHIRLSPGGMSRIEADDFDASMEDIMAELSDQMDRAEQETKANRTAIEKLTASVQDKLQNAGFTPYVARQQAELIAQRAVTRAQRMGREITGDEFDTTEVRQVLPPALSAARKADATDLVINALRKGGDAMQQGGQSLLQFIAKRGGINDSGGDLASMGVDKWHRGKPGQKKAIRPFDPQASLGGITGAGDYGVDSTLRAAIEAGYFPELANVENEAGASTLDTQALLDAIGQELAGSPRYAQEARVDNMRAAAEELRSLLSERGLDPAQMTDAELRAEMAKLDEAGPDGGYEQADPVGSEAFKRWFGDSKVVDAEGRPLVVYHGSPDLRELNDAGVFRTNDERAVAVGVLGGDWVDRARAEAAYFFTPDRKAASTYTDSFRAFDRENAEPGLVPAYLSIQNPLEIDFEGERWTGTDQAIAQAKAEGHDGVIIRNVRDHYRSGKVAKRDKPHMVAVAFNPEQIKSINNRGTFDPADPRILYQSFGEGPRGRIVFPEGGFGSGPSIIELFKDRNLSTLTHELGHQWLEELRYDATAEDAPDQLKADWQTVQAWFAGQGHPITDGVIPVEAHEMWARGIERYMLEGKAPSSSLKRLFETFRGWLVAIYKTVDRLRAPISPEVREVMDRLIATDEEITQARDEQALNPLFTDPAAVGMTGPEFDAYTTQVQNARGEAQGKLLEKTMAAIRRRETEQYRERRAGVETEVRESVDARPLYRSLTAMKATPINQAWLVDRMGQDVLSLLPKRVPPIYRDGGAHPDAIAEMAGYGSGEEMVNDLIGAEAQHRQAKEGGDQRSMRERTIATETEAEMNRRYGDTLNDGSIEREALAAVHNEMQGEVIASEIRVLARRTGQRATPYAIARTWARQKVRQGVYTEEASPSAIQRHARAVAKAGREAEKAVLAGNTDEAFRFKQQQMLSSALLAEAKEANDDAGKAVRRMNRIARAQTMKSVDQEYLEQAHALLDAVQLRERTQKSISRQGKWAAWAEARAAEGYDVVVPPSFEADLGKTHWTRLPVETLLGLDEAVKQVVHLGRLKQTLLDNQERREKEELYQEAEAAGGNISGPPPKGLEDPSFWEAQRARVLGWDAGLLKMETVFDWLDGGNANGVFNRVVFRPIANAQGRANDMVKDYHGRIRALFEALPEKVVDRWSERVAPPFFDRFTGRPMNFSRQKIISMALNTGNAGNLQRLADGYQVNPQALVEYLAGELTAEEWAFVQGVWDTIDTLWPEIEAMERRVNGIAPEKVEPTEIVTPYGTFRGGYFPAIYDSKLDRTAQRQQGSSENELFELNAVRATTRSSATKERSEKVSRPILLDLGVINRHLGEVIHDITHREAVMQAWEFLSNDRVATVVDNALGRQVTDQLRPWVKFVANSWALERSGNEAFGAAIGKLRANVTAVGLGLRGTTMVTQIAGYSNSVEALGEGGELLLSQAIARTSASPIETGRFVMEKSAEIRNRLDNLDRDIRTELARINAKNPVTKAAVQLDEGKKFLFYGIGMMDRVVVVPTWMAAYNKALAQGMEDADAVYYADKIVRQSQGAGAPKDLAAIQRGTGNWGQALKLFTMFYSFFSAQYQRQRTLGRDVLGKDVRRPRNVPRLAARAFWMVVVPPLLVEVLKGAVGGGGGPEDDEWWLQWTARKLIANQLGAIPVARDIFEPVWNRVINNKTFTPSISPLQGMYDSFAKNAGNVGKIARGEETKTATKDALTAAGYVTGLVPGQVAQAAQFWVDVGQGDVQPEGFWDYWEGTWTGKLKD